ncbi:M24 family metallopeptidase [Chloroflexota bacterium]
MSEELRKKNLRQPISKAELERRWKAVREAMAGQKLDCLITHSAGRFLGGAVRYFTDVPVSSYGGLVVFPLEGEMTLISHAAPSPASPPEWMVFNTQRISRPYIPTMNFDDYIFPAEVAIAIKKSNARSVGIVNKSMFPLSFYEYLKENLPDVTFSDATDLLTAIRAVKSQEEIDLMQKTCLLQDKVMYAVMQMIRPGVCEYEILSEVKRMCTDLGSEEQLVLIGTAPRGMNARWHPEFYQNRVIRDGDNMAILIETNGLGGLWTEIARNFCMGEAPKELLKAWSDIIAIQKELAKAHKPGATAKCLWDYQNKLLTDYGYPPETRLSCHSQGYDIVERPVVRPEEPMLLKENMVMAIHPMPVTREVFVDPCANYLITAAGGALMHKCAQEVFIV